MVECDTLSCNMLYGHVILGGCLFCRIAVPAPYPYPSLLYQGGFRYKEGLHLRRCRCRCRLALEVFLQALSHLYSDLVE